MRSSRTSATLAALALAASAGVATAADATAADTQAEPAAAAQADSRRAVRDKVTGQLRAPTSEEAEAMRASQSAGRSARGAAVTGAKTAPLRVVQHSGGMRSAVLGTEYLVTLKAQRQPDGSLAITHNQPGLDHPVSRDVRPTE
jgi:hypothetical protein